MTLSLEARSRCHMCGYWLAVHIAGTARISKRSMRLRAPLFASPRSCPECGEPVHQLAWDKARLTPESQAEVEAYRARRWPELAQEAAREAA